MDDSNNPTFVTFAAPDPADGKEVMEEAKTDEVEAVDDVEAVKDARGVPPKDGWRRPAPTRPNMMRRASAFFKGFGLTNEEDEDVYVDHIFGLSGSATDPRGSVNQSERDLHVSPVQSMMGFGFKTKTLVVCLIMFLIAFFVPALCINPHHIFLELSDPDTRFEFVGIMCSIPPIWIYMVWAAERVVPSSGTATKKLIRPNRSGFLMLLCVQIEMLKAVIKEIVRDEHHEFASFIINRALAFSMFAFWISLMDDGVLMVQNFADKAEEITKKSPKTKMWKGFMRDMARFQDTEIDRAYSIPGGSRSPARVLADVFGVYATLGKATAFVFLFLFMVGVDLYSSLVTFGLSALFLSVIHSLHINEALSNLLPLAIGNTLHLGEIISLSSAGGAPGDNPAACLTGFVEGITWSHVVIRDFKRKQCFIPHKEMTNLSIYNWSRRPSKCLRVVIAINVTHGTSGAALRVSKMSQFIQKWVKAHPSVDHSLYSKIALSVNDQGQATIEVICYHTVKSSFKAVRAELGIMIMEVARRLDLCLVTPMLLAKDVWTASGDNAAATAAAAGYANDNLHGEGTGNFSTAGLEDLQGSGVNTASANKPIPEDVSALLADLMPSENLSKLAGTVKKPKKE